MSIYDQAVESVNAITDDNQRNEFRKEFTAISSRWVREKVSTEQAMIGIIRELRENGTIQGPANPENPETYMDYDPWIDPQGNKANMYIPGDLVRVGNMVFENSYGEVESSPPLLMGTNTSSLPGFYQYEEVIAWTIVPEADPEDYPVYNMTSPESGENAVEGDRFAFKPTRYPYSGSFVVERTGEEWNRGLIGDFRTSITPNLITRATGWKEVTDEVLPEPEQSEE